MAKAMKPRLPKGFRDFLPSDMIKRDYVISIVKRVFERYGFEQLQTPVLELRDTLYGKYGEDAENLIYDAQHGRSNKDPLAMRYDLTVPLARVVAMHENNIQMPFRRYHIAPVWRGERPQRGRYREFYQCDADIVGVESMLADAELISLTIEVLRELGFTQFTTKINNRKLLTAMGQYSGVPDEQLADLYRSVDKYDKVGADGVAKELRERDIADDVVNRMIDLIQAKQDDPLKTLDYLEEIMGNFDEAKAGINELRDLANYMSALGTSSDFYDFDFTVVRGLGYYTGPIWETIIEEPNLGSINGGGRYNDLIGIFRKESLPTSGTSLGIERIIDLMDELNLYPDHIGGTVIDVLVTRFSDETVTASLSLAQRLRAGGINTELYMENRKLGKQFGHADKKGIPVVAIIGADEMANEQVKFKRLADGEEITVKWEEAVNSIHTLLGRS